jgi:hypothetical protein
MKSNKSLLWKSVLVLLSLVFSLLLGEIIIRLFVVTPTEYVIKDPIVGHKYLPDKIIYKRDPESKEVVKISINSDGYRDGEHEIKKPQGSLRIVVLGDSFVAGMAVDQEKLFTTLLEKKLCAGQASKKFEVFNFGVSGYGTAQEYLALKEYGLRYSPDIVIQFFFVGNDVWDNSKDLSGSRPVCFDLDGQGALIELPVSQTRQKTLNLLNRYSKLYVWQKGAVNKFVHTLLNSFIPKIASLEIVPQNTISKLSVEPEWYVFSEQYSKEWEKAWEITQKLIIKVKMESERHGAKYLLVSIPRPHQVYDDYWQTNSQTYTAMSGVKWDRTKPQKILERFTKVNNIDYISLMPLFQQDYARSGKRVSYRGGHFTDYGHLVVADILYNKLVEELAGNSLKSQGINPVN